MANIWVVRAGKGGTYADEFEQIGIAAIGFGIEESASALKSRNAILSVLKRQYPNMKKGRAVNWASQLHRFVHEIKQGDTILTPIQDTREIMIGTCSGPYRFELDQDRELHHIRPVSWTTRIPRDKLSVQARNSAGSTLTLFSMNEHRAEIEALASGKEVKPDPDTGSDEGAGTQLFEEVRGQAEELISDKITHMDPFDFEELVAALLRAMGYFASRTAEGADRGVDVIAQSDALGLESPRIKVQVKQRSQRAGAVDLRNFIATLRGRDRGLFVSTGGFSREALYEAERVPAGVSVTTLTRDGFIKLLTDHYDRLEPEARAMIPLRKVFIPID